MIDASPSGSSSSVDRRGMRPSIIAGSRVSSRWSVPRCRATCLAYGASSKERSAKPTEKLFTSPPSWVIIAVTALESMPPERKTPSGTSLMSSLRTDSRRTPRRRAHSWSRSIDFPSRSTFSSGAQYWRIDATAQLGVAQQRLQLRREHEAVAGDRVVQRLDAHAVAGKEERVLHAVQKAERELAVETLDHLLAPLFPAVDEHLGVGLRREHVAGGEQLLAQLEVVEDLAVLDDPHGRVLVVHRLVPAGEVDDRQPAHAERYAVELDRAFVVGPAVGHRRAHPRDELATERGIPARDATDAAHLVDSRD